MSLTEELDKFKAAMKEYRRQVKMGFEGPAHLQKFSSTLVDVLEEAYDKLDEITVEVAKLSTTKGSNFNKNLEVAKDAVIGLHIGLGEAFEELGKTMNTLVERVNNADRLVGNSDDYFDSKDDPFAFKPSPAKPKLKPADVVPRHTRAVR